MPNRRKFKNYPYVTLIQDLTRLRDHFQGEGEHIHAHSINNILNEVQRKKFEEEKKLKAQPRTLADDIEDDDHADDCWVHDSDMGAKG